jgi:hypothetical protein
MNFNKKDYYGDKHRWFIATVVNNRDPDAANRLQVRIRGIHSENQVDIPQSGLPWAHTALPVTEGGTSGLSRIVQVRPGSLVYGVFLDGETSQLPLVLGVLTQVERPTSVQQQASQAAGAATSPGVDAAVPPPPSTPEVNSRRFAAMRFFTSNGLTPIQASGIVGNLEGENSTFDPGTQSGVVTSGSREQSYGIAQWNAAAGRFQNLQRFAARINQPWDNFDTQLRFVLHEMNGNHVASDGGGSEARAFQRLRRCTRYDGGPIETNATWIITRYYERPADPRGVLATREEFARRAYEQFNSSVISPNDDKLPPEAPTPTPNEYPFIHPADAARNIWTFDTLENLNTTIDNSGQPFGSPRVASPGRALTFLVRINDRGGQIAVVYTIIRAGDIYDWDAATLSEYVARGGSVSAETRALDNIVRLPD